MNDRRQHPTYGTVARLIALPAPDLGDLTIYTTKRGVALGAASAELVAWLEQAFPSGTWNRDEDGRPLYHLAEVRHAAAVLDGEPGEYPTGAVASGGNASLPSIGTLVTMDDRDNGTSYEGTVIAHGGPHSPNEVKVEWHQHLKGEDAANWINVSSLRGFDPEAHS